MSRIFFILALFLAGILFPWWVVLPLSLYIAARFTAYELIPFGFLMDRLYGTSPSILFGYLLPFEGVAYTFLLLGSLLFFLSLLAKRSLIFYAP